MAARQRYILDADVFITAKNRYYAFDVCPGFWASVIHHHRAGRTYSIDRVKSELLVGRRTEDLVQWVMTELPASFFLGVDEEAVAADYTEIMMWVQQSAQFFDHAKAKFATGADGWIVAHAKVHGAIVVTNEERAPQIEARGEAPRRLRPVRRAVHGHVSNAEGPWRSIRVRRRTAARLTSLCLRTSAVCRRTCPRGAAHGTVMRTSSVRPARNSTA